MVVSALRIAILAFSAAAIDAHSPALFSRRMAMF
jgi:hypothetical protein